MGTSTVTVGGNGDTSIYSAAIIDGAGGLAGKETTTDSTGTETTTGMDVVSALYAEEGAQINLSGTNTIQTYYADPTDKHTSERVVWAYKGAKIDIDGETHIKTYNYDESPNSGDIAIAAGTATDLKDEDFTEDKLNSLEKATVHLNYKAGSSIEGDILAAYGGEVHISNAAMKAKAAGEEASFDGINIHGNLLAGNTGVLNVNLGNGGRLEGRADDYGDAGTVENSGHATANEEGVTFFDPAFSSKILTGGTVNLTMGSDSTWEVTGQSWITSVNTLGSENVVIDLTSAKSDLNKKARALTIGEMKGDAVFSMRLDGDRSASDMLYIKNADNGKYFINLENPVTVEDMYNGFDGLRFATVGKGSHATFSAGTYGNGVYNVEYEVGTDDYATSTENNAYNSTANDGQMDAAKPGNDLVDNLFKDEPQEAAANGIMTLAAVASPEATDSSDTTEDMGTNTGMNGEVLSDTTNFKLIDVKSTELSNAGKTIIDMSKVNYSNAIYMDRLNKRMGEARYIDGDEGLWVRIRHDRIGKSDAFRSKNTMMELGYDKRVDDREDGEHRRGFAIDYMRGTTDYHNVAGDGDVRRGGVWFYDTWLGNKGHYSDYVLKFGRLSNDFDIYSELGEKITGDYSNFVYSASAEYGRKKDIGKDWYFEPQVQLQYAHVTDADYTTSQGTSVELDAIDSLIGRIGFRLGKDMGENNTFYVKADVLHEFLGDQDISAFDATGRLDTTYENEGTWYDVGLGFSHQFSKGTYMFLDVEKTFGNDNEDTYQFNVGMNWKV
ncbi:autotransporter outer membrane beta-barrel domain-containing protein [uncultured Megasphaera sp.]|uniref:autotransporter outer membrane beta-barrel domain-containing protein n=1 Tax=uncultured Megasphaera sp. TaxID=165188 RepID=UPI0026134B84|nr:autotransporter outer membrane beta-barrel domain-containing protein [uncultured Megasphaera sp.]